MVEGLVELAIAKAFGRDVQAIWQAMLLSGDIAQVALLAKKDASVDCYNEATCASSFHVSRCDVLVQKRLSGIITNN